MASVYVTWIVTHDFRVRIFEGYWIIYFWPISSSSCRRSQLQVAVEYYIMYLGDPLSLVEITRTGCEGLLDVGDFLQNCWTHHKAAING